MGTLITRRRYNFGDVTSAMQKAIRRGDTHLAGYFGIELYVSGYKDYVWRRLLTISAEDCWGIITREVKALHDSWGIIMKAKGSKADCKTGRVFVAKAIILLCQAKKSRDADHLTNLLYDNIMLDKDRLVEELQSCGDSPVEEDIPQYAYDCHTRMGRIRGETKEKFFKDEQAALQPRMQGEFDKLLEQTTDTRDTPARPHRRRRPPPSSTMVF